MTIDEKALDLHEKLHGKLSTEAKCHVNSREDLSLAYTPGVAEPCRKIAANEEDVYKYTWKSNTVAVVSDGSAVLGLGNKLLWILCVKTNRNSINTPEFFK